MLLRLTAALLLSLCAVPAEAQISNDEQLRRAAPLLARLAGTRREIDSRPVEQELWLLWSLGPDDDATRRLAQGRASIRVFDLDGAVRTLGALVEDHPDFAEAWNQKAFAHFLRREHDQSLEDLDRALALQPEHFGALSGRALNLLQQGRDRLGQQALREALEVHPWLPERALLTAPPEEDI